jgi:glucan biosynthesis protein C
MKERRYDIDWLRVIAMLGVFLMHSTRFFCTEDWQLKVPAAQQSDMLGILRDFFISVWLMPLFFLVAGFAARYSLRRRTVGQYLVERAKRILIPLYTVGLFILVVPQNYFEDFTHGRTTMTFWQWLPDYYLQLPQRVFSLTRHNYLDPIQLVPYGFSGHLWFLQMLFIILLLTLPLFRLLESKRGQRFVDQLAGWCNRRGGLFLLVIPPIIFEVALRWLPKTTDRTWADFFWYAWFYIIGFIIAMDDRFTASIKRNGWICLALWILLFIGAGGLFLIVLEYDTSPGQGFSLLYVLWWIIQPLFCFSSVMFMVSVAAKYLTFTNKFLAYANEAVLPFFMFHQTVIQIIGWFVLPLGMANVLKWLIITVVSFPLTLALYEVCVRRIDFMRFLFGMAPQKKIPAVPPA